MRKGAIDRREGTHIVDPTIHQILRRAPVEEYSKLAPSPLLVVLVDRHDLNGASTTPLYRARHAKLLCKLFAG